MDIYNKNSLNATFLHLNFMLIDFYHAQKGKKIRGNEDNLETDFTTVQYMFATF